MRVSFNCFTNHVSGRPMALKSIFVFRKSLAANWSQIGCTLSRIWSGRENTTLYLILKDRKIFIPVLNGRCESSQNEKNGPEKNTKKTTLRSVRSGPSQHSWWWSIFQLLRRIILILILGWRRVPRSVRPSRVKSSLCRSQGHLQYICPAPELRNGWRVSVC